MPPPLPTGAERGIPARLEHLIISCLAKDPSDRPRSAIELRASLGEMLEGEPWSESEAMSWWNRNVTEA
jgi:serine/threonine-protein kinase